MSQPFARYLHPFDVTHNPSLEPEVKRAILASWASDRNAVRDHPGMRQSPEIKGQVSVDDVDAAMRSLDGLDSQPTLQ